MTAAAHSDGPAGPLELLGGYQPAAVLMAACESGVADGLARGPLEPGALAAGLDLDTRAVGLLCDALIALGLVERREGGLTLSGLGAPLASDHPGSVARVAAKEHYFYRVWADLRGALAGGHAVIAPWPDRLRGEPAEARGFLVALGDLAAMFGTGLPDLAGIGDARTLLDVGGGVGSYAAILRGAHPGLSATVLDLPEVEPWQRERHPELAFAAGDLHADRFGQPADAAYDAVLVSNVLHDHPPDEARAICARAAGLLEPGGALVLHEWLRVEPPSKEIALFALMMLVEDEGGTVYPSGELEGWLRQLGLVDVETRPGSGPLGVVRGCRPGPGEG